MNKNSKRTTGVNVRRIKFETRADLFAHLHFAGIRRKELNKLTK
jgi:hypothetical protein